VCQTFVEECVNTCVDDSRSGHLNVKTLRLYRQLAVLQAVESLSVTPFTARVQRVCSLSTRVYPESCRLCLIYSDSCHTPKELNSGLVVRVPGYRTEMYCVFCEVRTEFIYITSCTRPRVAVAHSGEMEEKEERGSARFTYV
jgi:hypothetical protein